MRNKIVVHYADGRLIKGWSTDINPHKPTFHLSERDTEQRREVPLAELKGVFFVKDFEGKRDHHQRRYDIDRPGLGRRVRVTFRDGETLEGYTNGYSANRLAFFVFTPDPEDNNDRILVVNQATADVKLV